MSASTSYYKIVLYMIILGLGIGINMPIANTNAQNSVQSRQIGSATSTVQFFRNVGGTIGSAIYGTIMTTAMNKGFSKLNLGNIPGNVQNLLKNPQIITNADSVAQITRQVPAKYAKFFETALEQAKKVLSDSIHEIFFFCMIVAAVGFVLTILFKDAPVRIRESEKKDEKEI